MVQQAATVAVDVYIVGVIVLGLRRSKSGWAHTDNLVHRLILWACPYERRKSLLTTCSMTLEAQLIPTLVSLVILILYAGRFATSVQIPLKASPKLTDPSADLLGGFFGIVQAKLYAVSLLFVLNSRFTFFRTNHTQSATVSQSRVSHDPRGALRGLTCAVRRQLCAQCLAIAAADRARHHRDAPGGFPCRPSRKVHCQPLDGARRD